MWWGVREAWFGKERKCGGGGVWEPKAGGQRSSVSYITRLNESVQKSELSHQRDRQPWPRNWNNSNTAVIRLFYGLLAVESWCSLIDPNIKACSSGAKHSCCNLFCFPWTSWSHMQVLTQNGLILNTLAWTSGIPSVCLPRNSLPSCFISHKVNMCN